KRRFCSNQFTNKQGETVKTSARKLCNTSSDNIVWNPLYTYRLIEFFTVFTLSDLVICSEKNEEQGKSIFNLKVSGDGSWKKRGFESLYGITDEEYCTINHKGSAGKMEIRYLDDHMQNVNEFNEGYSSILQNMSYDESQIKRQERRNLNSIKEIRIVQKEQLLQQNKFL
ncbi:hypothetical protein ALC53_07668, partial [Atta colombica]